MRPLIRLPELSPEAIAELDQLYRTTHDVRLRTQSPAFGWPLNNT